MVAQVRKRVKSGAVALRVKFDVVKWKRGVDVGGCAVMFWDFLACVDIRPPLRSARAHHQQAALGGSEHI